MNSLNLKGKQRKKRKISLIQEIADNILKRYFYAAKTFEKLTTDVSEFEVCDKKVYLSPVMDLYNREIVS